MCGLVDAFCVDCELLEGSTVADELALKIPRPYTKREVAGVVVDVTFLKQ